MTNPNTDTVEAVARAICRENCEGAHPADMKDGICRSYGCILWRAHSDAARAAIAAMPGSGEAMREAAAETAFIQSKQGATHRQIAAAIRALPLPPAQEG